MTNVIETRRHLNTTVWFVIFNEFVYCCEEGYATPNGMCYVKLTYRHWGEILIVGPKHKEIGAV